MINEVDQGLKANKTKINLFAFPNQTAVLFWVIAATLVGAVIIGTSGLAPMPIWWISPVLLFLSLWRFVSQPDRVIRQGMLVFDDEQFPLLRSAIQSFSTQLGLKRIPMILIKNEENRLYTVGSFRRWYIVLSVKTAQELEIQLGLQEKVETANLKIVHELYHFKNGDYWQLGLLTGLFQTIFPLMLWFMMFFGGWILLLGLASQSFLQLSPSLMLENMPPETTPMMERILASGLPSDTEMDAIREKATGTNFFAVASFVFNVSIPLIFIAILLWFFYLPLIWQMREFYADAGMVQTVGSSAAIWKKRPNLYIAPVNTTRGENNLLNKIRNKYSDISQRLIEYLKRARRFSPYGRVDALLEPQRAFYNWKRIAFFLGGLVLVLEVFLATPLTLPFIGQNPMHFSTLIVVVSVAYFLLPRLVLGKSGWLDAVKIILVVNCIRLAWLLLTLSALWGLYFVAPEYLTEILMSAIYSTARYAGNASFDFDLSEFIVEASVVNLVQVPIIFIFQLISTLSLTLLFGRMFKWYSYHATSEVFKKTVFALTMGMALILLFILLPISTAILTGNPGLFVQPMMAIQVVVGALTLIGMAFWFYQNDKKYFGKCPRCGREVMQSSQFLDNCSECREVLYPWLWTEYDDE
jgi:hypothetical protein